MHALQLVDDSTVTLREVPDPTPQPDEALVAVRMAGICSTDLQLARGYMGFAGTLGHEFVGEVTRCDGDPGLVGARVVGEINAACGRCDACRNNLGRHCATRTVLGIAGRDGCFADALCLPMRNLHRVPDGLSDERACFAEPVAAAYEILEQRPQTAGERVAVLGDGKLGQLIAQVLHAAGAQVCLVGRHRDKLELARAMGIGGMLDAEAAAVTDRRFFTVVEATGTPEGLERALGLVRPRGTVVLKSTYKGSLSLDMAPFVIDEITLLGSRCGPFSPALEALSRGTVDPVPLIAGRYPLSEAETAFAHAGRRGVLKVLLDMRAPG